MRAARSRSPGRARCSSARASPRLAPYDRGPETHRTLARLRGLEVRDGVGRSSLRERHEAERRLDAARHAPHQVVRHHEVPKGPQLRVERLRVLDAPDADGGEREHRHREQPGLVAFEVVEAGAGRLVERAPLRLGVAGQRTP